MQKLYLALSLFLLLTLQLTTNTFLIGIAFIVFLLVGFVILRPYNLFSPLGFFYVSLVLFYLIPLLSTPFGFSDALTDYSISIVRAHFSALLIVFSFISLILYRADYNYTHTLSATIPHRFSLTESRFYLILFISIAFLLVNIVIYITLYGFTINLFSVRESYFSRSGFGYLYILSGFLFRIYLCICGAVVWFGRRANNLKLLLLLPLPFLYIINFSKSYFITIFLVLFSPFLLRIKYSPLRLFVPLILLFLAFPLLSFIREPSLDFSSLFDSTTLFDVFVRYFDLSDLALRALVDKQFLSHPFIFLIPFNKLIPIVQPFSFYDVSTYLSNHFFYGSWEQGGTFQWPIVTDFELSALADYPLIWLLFIYFAFFPFILLSYLMKRYPSPYFPFLAMQLYITVFSRIRSSWLYWTDLYTYPIFLLVGIILFYKPLKKHFLP